MPVEILASGSGSANSATVTVTAAAPVTVSLKHASGFVPVFGYPDGVTAPQPPIFVQSQDDGGAWNFTGEVLDATKPTLLLNRPGVYRVRRLLIDNTIGVFRSDP